MQPSPAHHHAANGDNPNSLGAAATGRAAVTRFAAIRLARLYADGSAFTLASKRPRSNGDGDDDGGGVERLLQCCVCLEAPGGGGVTAGSSSTAATVQCRNGHLLCGSCGTKPEVTTCPVCRVATDPSNPIRCLLASHVADEERERKRRRNEEGDPVLECKGGCGWSCVVRRPPGRADGNDSRDGGGDAAARLAAHEGGCVAALRKALQQMEEKVSDLGSKFVALQSTVESLGKRREGEEEQAGSSRMGAGSVGAAWRYCVETYRAGPMQGAEVYVAKQTHTSGGTRLVRLYCRVPGTSCLTGLTFHFIVQYDPCTLRVCTVLRLRGAAMEPVLLPVSNAEVTIYELLEALQRSVFGGISAISTQTEQMRSRCSAFDEMAVKNDVYTVLAREFVPMLGETAVEVPSGPQERTAVPEDLLKEKSPPSKTIKVSNLPYSCTESDLRDFFASGGFQPSSSTKPSYTTSVRGGRVRKNFKVDHGEVVMKTCLEAYEAAEALKGKTLRGRPLSLTLSSSS